LHLHVLQKMRRDGSIVKTWTSEKLGCQIAVVIIPEGYWSARVNSLGGWFSK